ncbi:MAG: hypothetical protein A2V93_06970 [Ignavibacteria bacterium RBG_16_34_14]|nr:MAG: hypothetical protein A2V93_06970 [Ignavibacteria bacterium RBG_16_34_14]
MIFSIRNKRKEYSFINNRIATLSNPVYFLFLSISFFFLISSNIYPQKSNVVFEHFTPDQGMSAYIALCVYQDKTGYLWFGTLRGLDRYDGYNFKIYKNEPGNPNTIANASVNTLYEDKEGNFWVGTSGGLDKFDRVNETFIHFTPHTPGPGTEWSNDISSVLEDKSNILWVGTHDGLNKFNRNTGKFICIRNDSTNNKSIIHNSINAILEDKFGTLWIGTGRGLDKFDRESGNFIHVWYDTDYKNRIADKDPKFWINTLFQDNSGKLWLGTSGGLIEFNTRDSSFTQYTYSKNDSRTLSSNNISSICQDASGILWIGTDWGVNSFDINSKKFTHYFNNEKDPGSLSYNVTSAVYYEQSGTLWITTPASVNKLNRTKYPFTQYMHDERNPESIAGNEIWSVFKNNTDKIWISTSKGWNKFDPVIETFTPYSFGSDFPIWEDNSGNLWMAMGSGGIYRRDSHGQITRFFWQSHGLPDSSGKEFNQNVNCIFESNGNKFWIGTNEGGIYFLNPSKNSVTEVRQTKTAILIVHEDSHRLLWATTREGSGGLMCYNLQKDTLVRFIADDKISGSISGNYALTLLEDKTGNMWFAANGLNKYDHSTGKFTKYTERDGLSSNVVFSIQEDYESNLWLSTMKGISKFNPKTGQFKNYNKSYGFTDNKFFPDAGCKTKNGEIYFGGPGGLTRFHPDNIKDNPFIAPVVLTTFSKFNEPFPFRDEINLPYTENFISFEFAALSFISPERNQYAYKMEGLDKDWVYTGTRRYATFSHLEPGEYIFRVKGSNNDGVWNEAGTSITIIITPPWWKTWWFTTFFWVTIAGLVGGTLRYVEKRKLQKKIEHLERERALEKERVRISQDMHDEVGSSLSEISILSELLKRDMGKSEEAETHLKDISERSAEVIENIGQIIWAINPRNDPLDNLVAHLRLYAADYIRKAGIKYSFEIPDNIPAYHLSAEVRRNVFLVVKEALHNIVKHSCASAVQVYVNFLEDKMKITIKDNGKGFSIDQNSGSGNGLSNMQERIENIGGTFKIESEPGQGTGITITVNFKV